MEWWWIFAFRLIGTFLFIAAFYLPFKAMFLDGHEEVKIGTTRWIFIGIGFVLAFSGKRFGEWANAIGAKIVSKDIK